MILVDSFLLIEIRYMYNNASKVLIFNKDIKYIFGLDTLVMLGERY